jgi:hypothetical protein
MVAERIPLPALRVDPANDRLPMARKLDWLVECGYWRPIERIVKAHGWQSSELAAFIDTFLPVEQCRWCEANYYHLSRRVSYCSDRCRRQAGVAVERAFREGTAQRVAALATPRVLPSYHVHLVRETQSELRVYILRLLPNLLGEVQLVVQHGIAPGNLERSYQFDAIAPAEATFIRLRDAALRRGYREEMA